MTVKIQKIAQTDQGPIELFTITNHWHNSIQLLSYGATWKDWQIQESGQTLSLVTHYTNWQDYHETAFNPGKTVAPVAGRITRAHFQLAGHDYQVTPNENENLLHSGPTGFQQQNFVGEKEAEQSVKFTYILPQTENVFPGDLKLTVHYHLTDEDRVEIEYQGTSNQTTLFNPTCHVYFNLDPTTSVNEQILTINADQYLELTEEKVPTGKFLPVAAATDFRQPKTIMQGLNALHEQTGKTEFDHVYYTPNDLVATLQTDQRAIDLYSDRDALVIYTGSPQNPQAHDWHDYTGLAMEMQSLPDAINHPEFGDIVLPAHKTISYKSSYQYRKL